MKRLSMSLCLVTLIALLFGCADPTNVALTQSFWDGGPQTIAIASMPQPTPTIDHESDDASSISLATVMTGIADGMRAFPDFLRFYSLASFYDINQEIAADLQKKGMKTIMVSDTIDPSHLKSSHQDVSEFADVDYTIYAGKIKADDLLLIGITSTGVVQRYEGSVYNGTPVPYCDVLGVMVDLKTNQLLWRKEADLNLRLLGGDGAPKWNDPPDFKTFSMTYNQLLLQAKNVLLDDFMSQAST